MRGLTTILLDELADERAVVHSVTYNGALALAELAGKTYDREFAVRTGKGEGTNSFFEVYSA